MEFADEDLQYEENFLFRKRLHSITDEGIRTQEFGFFNASESFIAFGKLGWHWQYKSQANWGYLMLCAGFLLFGIRGLMISAGSSILFAICLILIGVAIYWLINYLYNLDYVGSYYLSDRYIDRQPLFEIKSDYPASEELERFFEQIKQRQKLVVMREMMEEVHDEVYLDDLLTKAQYLKKNFSLTDEEYDEFADKLKKKYDFMRNRNDKK